MSSALSRRIANRRAEAIQKLIVFCIGEAQFALPIQAAERVVALEQLYGSPSGIGLQFAIYQDREILVIDAQQRIFGTHKTRSLLPAPRSAPDNPAPNNPAPNNPDPNNPDPGSPPASTALALLPPAPPAYLLILQTASETPIGITLSAPPTLRRVPLSAFKPLPSAYLATGSIRCVSALIAIGTPSEPEEAERLQEPPLFLLNIDLLLQPRSR
jgi:hypothetical protein